MRSFALQVLIVLTPRIAAAITPADLEEPADKVDAEIDARFDDDLEHAVIDARFSFTSAVKLEAIPIVLAADRYRKAPPLSPSEVREIYPAGFSRGGFRRVKIVVDGGPCKPRKERLAGGARIFWCTRALAAGETTRVEIHAELDVPRRFGPFGWFGREVTLAAGWYPYVARPSAGPPRGRHRVRVDAPASFTTVIRSHHFPGGGVGRRNMEAIEENAAQIPLLFRPAHFRALSIAGGRARHLTGPASLLDDPEEETLYVREVRSAIEDGLAFWLEEGFDLPAPDRPLIVARAALRHDLAQAADGLVLVSDRAFRMLDVNRFLRFHRFPILREIFGELIDRRLDKTADRVLSRDAIASWLVDRYVASRFGKAEDAFDVLGIVSFIPSIDSMLYAPDLPYVSAYFRVMREDDPHRPDLLAFPQPAPRGKLIYEKLIDRFGASRASGVMQALVAGTPLTSAVRAAFDQPREAERFLKAWLGPYPDLQYRLANWASKPAPEICPTCTRAEVIVERIGAVAEEPIELRLIDDNGASRWITASATTAATRTITATLSAPLDVVELDPRGRLAEMPTIDNPSPRYDNRSSRSWKILLNNFNILVAATEGAIDTAIDIGLARRYDVHWAYAFRADYAQDAAALSARASYSFGKPVNAARLSQFVGVGVSTEILREGFAKSASGGTAIGVSASYGYDDRRSIWAPEDGNAFRVSASYYRVFGADLEGSNTTNESIGLTARALKQWRIGLRHQISLRGSLAAYVVGRPRPQLLWSLGGRGGVRGYALDAELGRVRAIGSVEWLHPLLPEFEANGFFMAWVNGLDGALYGDVGLIGDDVEEARSGPLFGDVGYGLRLYIDYLGVRPGVMSVDFALPLVRARGAMELGPPAIYIAFAQSFTSF